MSDLTGHGGSAVRSGGSFLAHAIRSWIVTACVLLMVCWWSQAAHAGSLYHCLGAQGEAVYSSSTLGYKGCKKLGSDGAIAVSRKPRHRRMALTAVTGSVVTTARELAVAAALRMSLTAVQGSAVTTARLPLATAGVGTPGQWSYHEAQGAHALAAVANDPGSRVLRGAVYRVVRSDGSVEYTNLRPAGQKGHVVTTLFSYIATCVACNLHSPIHWGSVSLNLTAYADTIRAASMEYGVDEAFLRAIIHAESAFNPRALSLKGAQGLMQLMPATASDMGVLDAFNSDQNIRGGARYLSLLLHDFSGNERLAAAAYNAGPGAVQRYNGVPPYAETQVYVERVGTLRKRYGAAIHPPLTARGPG